MINLNYLEIGKKIKERRKSLNLTQLELAEKIGLTESSISRYESGKISTMPTSTINDICNVLGLIPGELLGLTPKNSLEYDLKQVLLEFEQLQPNTKKSLICLFKEQIKLCKEISNDKVK